MKSPDNVAPWRRSETELPTKEEPLAIIYREIDGTVHASIGFLTPDRTHWIPEHGEEWPIERTVWQPIPPTGTVKDIFDKEADEVEAEAADRLMREDDEFGVFEHLREEG